MANPYAGTEYETTWDQGYSFGYANPSDTNPSPPLAYSENDAQVYLEGAAAGRDAVAAGSATGDGGMSGGGDGGYSVEGTEPLSSEPTTNPEVTVYGDPDSVGDPNSGDDAYADGYWAGYNGTGFDDSHYADAAKPRYGEGWSAGAAAKKLEGDEHHHSAGEVIAEEAIPHLVGEAIGHALKVGFGGVVLGAILGGPDTMLKEAPAYMALCHRGDHGLSGDAVFDGGAWHSDPTMDFNYASSYGAEHASSWGHDGDDDVHVWSYQDDNWDMFD